MIRKSEFTVHRSQLGIQRSQCTVQQSQLTFHSSQLTVQNSYTCGGAERLHDRLRFRFHFLGSELQPFSDKFNVFCMQAFAMWRWWNEYEMRVAPGKTILKLNLDETSVCVYQGNVEGNVFLPRGRHPTLAQHVPRAMRRKNLTFVAMVSDNADIQLLLPQFIIGNYATFPARDIGALRATCPPNVFLIRQKSAWNNETLLIVIIRALREALEPHMEAFQPVLIFDAVALHLGGMLLWCM